MANQKHVEGQNYLDMFYMIMQTGHTISPRGFEIKEKEDLQLVVDPIYPFMNFEDRHYDVEYFKKEMKWKLGASKYDDSIEEHAKMWATVKNPDGTFNSNYGQYWFGEQGGIWSVLMELIRDMDSRRAAIPMMNASHFAPHVKDTVCTESVGFRIRNGLLNMSIHMRSSDVIYGLGTDIPTFAFLYRLLAGLYAPINQLGAGYITITAMSSHIYSRHYEMVRKIMDRGLGGFNKLEMPRCNYREAMMIIASRGKDEILKDAGDLGRWLSEKYT